MQNKMRGFKALLLKSREERCIVEIWQKIQSYRCRVEETRRERKRKGEETRRNRKGNRRY